MFSVNFNLNSYSGLTVCASVKAFGHIGRSDREPAGIRPGDLVIPWHDPIEDPSELSLLSWHTEISDFSGRDKELRELETWAEGTPAVSVKFVIGEGGTGKSRLAAEFGRILYEKGWAAGFVHLKKYQPFFLHKKGTLLIVDYPEEFLDEVLDLLSDLAALGNEARIRVLFLTRQHEGQWDDLISDSSATFVAGNPIVVGKLDEHDAHALYHSALKKLEEIYGKWSPPLNQEALTAWLETEQENLRPLFILAAAVHSAINPEDVLVQYRGRDIIKGLVDREISRLRKVARNRDAVDPMVFAHVRAMATIADKIPAADMVDLVQREGDLLGYAPDRNIADELKEAGLLINGIVHALKPDIVAAAFTIEVLASTNEVDPRRASMIFWEALKGDPVGALQRLERLAHDAETVYGPQEKRIGAWLADAVRGDHQRCEILDDIFSRELPSRHQLDAAVTCYETLLDEVNDEYERARLLNSLSIHLSEAGDRAGAREASEEAVDLFRCLSLGNPDRYEPDLAGSLNNLSNRLSDVGDDAGALEGIKEAVELYRRLSQTNPAGYEPDLALSLNTLSNRLSEAGDGAGALEAVEEAVEIRHRLSEADPARYEPDLGGSLNNLSNCLSEAGDLAGALESIEEAVEIRRRLSQANPARYEPDLAMSLNNLAISLSEAGDSTGAFEAIEGAVDLYRRLSQTNPARYEPDLALSLNTLSKSLSQAGDGAGTLEAIEEAVDLCRRLSQANPARYEPDLATTLNTLSICLSEAGDRAGALEASKEAVEIRRRLSQANPVRYEPYLARSLGARAAVLLQLGRRVEATEAIREGIEFIEPYASQWPNSPHGRVLETLEAHLALAVSEDDTKPVKGERSWRRILRILGVTGS